MEAGHAACWDGRGAGRGVHLASPAVSLWAPSARSGLRLGFHLEPLGIWGRLMSVLIWLLVVLLFGFAQFAHRSRTAAARQTENGTALTGK